MHLNNRVVVIAMLLSTLLVGCSGSDLSNQDTTTVSGIQAQSSNTASAFNNRNKDNHKKIKFSSQISFGDSLSDVGSYAVGTIAALGGGQFTVNSAKTQNWTALMAAQFGLSAPCAAQTGLDGDPALGFSVMPPLNHEECTSYAQGGARVTSPIGIGNKLTGGDNVALGLLTVPVVQQIQNHLSAHDNKFKKNEVVLIMAGANDVFFQLALLQAAAIDPATAMTSLTLAASELADAINTQIVGKGAQYVVVLNIPDIAITPLAALFDAPSRGLLDAMVNTFNAQLKNALNGNSHVLYVDAYAESYNQYVNPGAYGLSNVTDTACDLSPAKNPLASSLICTTNTLISGITDRYLFSDRVHPTPYGYGLIASLVSNEMSNRGWRWRKQRAKGNDRHDEDD